MFDNPDALFRHRHPWFTKPEAVEVRSAHPDGKGPWTVWLVIDGHYLHRENAEAAAAAIRTGIAGMAERLASGPPPLDRFVALGDLPDDVKAALRAPKGVDQSTKVAAAQPDPVKLKGRVQIGEPAP